MKHETIYPMTTDQFDQLIIEIRGLKTAVQALAKKNSGGASVSAPGEIPMPSEVIAGAENVTIHFGKNQGKPLGELSAKQLEWYAQEPEPRLKKDGTPFAPRAEDVRLRNAARTIIAQRLGKLPDLKPILATEDETDEVPF